VGSGEWGVGSGEWGVGSGEWEVGREEGWTKSTLSPSPTPTPFTQYTTCNPTKIGVVGVGGCKRGRETGVSTTNQSQQSTHQWQRRWRGCVETAQPCPACPRGVLQRPRSPHPPQGPDAPLGNHITPTGHGRSSRRGQRDSRQTHAHAV